MKNYSSIKPGLLIGTIILIISSIINPMTIGHNVRKPDNAIITGNYDSYNVSEIPNFIQHCNPKELNTFNNIKSERKYVPVLFMTLSSVISKYDDS